MTTAKRQNRAQQIKLWEIEFSRLEMLMTICKLTTGGSWGHQRPKWNSIGNWSAFRLVSNSASTLFSLPTHCRPDFIFVWKRWWRVPNLPRGRKNYLSGCRLYRSSLDKCQKYFRPTQKTRQDIFWEDLWLLFGKYSFIFTKVKLQAKHQILITMLSTDKKDYWNKYFIWFYNFNVWLYCLNVTTDNGTRSNSRQKHQLFCLIFFYREGQEKAFYHNVRILYKAKQL